MSVAALNELIEAAQADVVEPPIVEFVGEDRPEFAALMQRNLRHKTVDNQGRSYRLVRMVFEEIR